MDKLLVSAMVLFALGLWVVELCFHPYRNRGEKL
jgi:hypothetical protein